MMHICKFKNLEKEKFVTSINPNEFFQVSAYLFSHKYTECVGDADVYTGRSVCVGQSAVIKVSKKKKGVIYQIKPKHRRKFLYLFHSHLCASSPCQLHRQSKLSSFQAKLQERKKVKSFSGIRILFSLHRIKVVSLTKPMRTDGQMLLQKGTAAELTGV